MREKGFRYHTMAEIERRGWEPVMEDIVREAKDGPEYLFVSFDIDTLDPAFVPGTGTPEPGGLTPREAFPIVRRLCAESNVVGFDLVEFAPERDPTYVSGLNANRIVRECLVGIAMRKKGRALAPPSIGDPSGLRMQKSVNTSTSLFIEWHRLWVSYTGRRSMSTFCDRFPRGLIRPPLRLD